MAIGQRIKEARLAVMLLTRLPAGTLTDPVPSLTAARWAYPFVGLIVGGLGWLAHFCALWLGLTPLFASVAALGTMALVTGALHHDGLADFADGIGGGRDRDHALDIMRDSRIGSYGVLAVIMAILLAASAMAGLGDIRLLAFLFIGAASRLAMVLVLDLLPPARGDGMGHMAAGQRSVLPWVPGGLLTLGLVLCVGTSALWAVLTMAIATLVLARLAIRKIGGQTGDVLGATQLVSETAGWIALAAALAT